MEEVGEVQILISPQEKSYKKKKKKPLYQLIIKNVEAKNQ